MITSATTVNTVYGQSAVNSTTNNKADGASFATAFANASSTPAKTSSIASADKVTISAQAQQASAQDDIETEAQAYVKTAMDDPMWKKGLIRVGFGGSENGIDSKNKQLSDNLNAEFNKMFGYVEAMKSPRFHQVQSMLSTLGASSAKQSFDESSLQREAKVIIRSQEILTQEWGKENNKVIPNVFEYLL